MRRAAQDKPILHSISWSAIFGFSSLLVGVLLLPFIIDRFGSEPYGVWLLLSTLSTFLFQADLGMGAAVVRFVAMHREPEARDRRGQIILTAVAWNCMIAVAGILILVPVAALLLSTAGAGNTLNGADLVALVSLAAIPLFFLPFRPFGNYLQGIGLWGAERSNQLVGIGFRVVGTIAVGLSSADIVHLAAVEACAMIIPGILSLIYAARRRSFAFGRRLITVSALKEQLSYSVRAFSVNLVGSAILQSGTIIVGIFMGASAVTYWNAIFRAYSVLRQVVQWSIDPFMPRLTVLFRTARQSGHRLYYGLTSLATSLAAASVPGLIVISGPLLSLWLGNTAPTTSMAPALQVLFASVVINVMHLPSIVALNAIGKPGAFFPLHLSWLASTVGVALVAVPLLGLLGMALAIALPLAALETVYLREASRALDLPFRAVARSAIVFPLVVLISASVPAVLGVALSAGGSQVWLWVGGLVSLAVGGVLLAYSVLKEGRNAHRFTLRQRS